MKRFLLSFSISIFFLGFAFFAPSDCIGGSIETAKKAIRMHEYAKAAKLYRELADKGNPEAMYELGSLYRLGRGVPKNNKLGYTYTLKAARLGHVNAQYSVGTMYERGLGTTKDLEKARYWFKKAAGKGHTLASKKLAALEENKLLENKYRSKTEALSAFFAAARKGDVKLLDAILKQGFPVNARDDAGRTALIEAAAIGAETSISFLITRGALLDARDNLGDTALIKAVRNKHFASAMVLVRAGSDVNVADKYGNTPLILAAKEGARPLIEMLINRGARSHHKNIAGQNAADVALVRKHMKTLALLKRHGIHPQTEKSRLSVQKSTDDLVREIRDAVKQQKGLDRTPLMLASQLGKVAVIGPLIRSGEQLDALSRDGFTAVGLAASSCHTDVLNALISFGADVNLRLKGGKTPLMLAAESERGTACVRQLIAAGANIDAKTADGSTALMIALKNGRVESSRALLKAGALVNLTDQKGSTPLILAVKETPELVPDLLSNGARHSHKDLMGRTALWYAAKLGRIEVVQLLLSYGADFSIPDISGVTPLHVAVQEGHLEVVEELIRRKANIESKTKDGNTPLMIAASSGNLSMIKKLVQSGARLNATNNIGDTAILMAAKKGDAKAVKLLLQLGANPNIRNDQNDNVRKIAEMRGYRGILQLLK